MSRQYTFRHGRRAQSPRSEADTKDDAQGIGESTSHVIKEETGKEAGADQPDERQPISSTASSPQSNGTLTPVDEPERDTPKQVEKLAGMSDSYAAPPTSLQTSQGEGRASANGASGTGERGGSGDQAQTVPGTPPAPAAVVPKQEDTPTAPGATPGRDLAARQSATPETPQGQRVDSQGNPVPGIQGSLPLYQQAGSYQQHVSQMNQLGAVRYSPYQPSTLSVLEPDPRKRDEAIPQASISPHHLKVPDAQTMNYYDSRAGTAAGAPPASYDPSGMVQYYQPQNHQQAVPMDGSRQVVQAALAQPASTVPPPKQSAAQMLSTFSTNPTNTTPKRYKCDICEKRFTRPSSLQTHMYSHTGEKPFMCPVPECGRRFSVVSNLRRHQKIHAPKTNP